MGEAEKDFWAAVAQERKEINGREKKRQEAMLPRGQHTPIPEEGAETIAEEKNVSGGGGCSLMGQAEYCEYLGGIICVALHLGCERGACG